MARRLVAALWLSPRALAASAHRDLSSDFASCAGPGRTAERQSQRSHRSGGRWRQPLGRRVLRRLPAPRQLLHPPGTHLRAQPRGRAVDRARRARRRTAAQGDCVARRGRDDRLSSVRRQASPQTKAATAKISDKTWFGRFYSALPVDVRPMKLTPAPAVRPEVYNHAAAALGSPAGSVKKAQFAEPITPPLADHGSAAGNDSRTPARPQRRQCRRRDQHDQPQHERSGGDRQIGREHHRRWPG